MKVLFATSNPAKVRSYQDALVNEGIELLTLKDIDVHVPVDENGKNALENAYIKAKTYYDATGLPSIGMDNNLFIEGIPENLQPGVFVRRVNGKELNDEEMLEHYTKLVRDFGGKLKARWIYGMVIVTSEGVFEYSWSYNDFYLVDKVNPKKNPGYPLDSISIDEELNKYFVDFTEKDQQASKKNNLKKEVIKFISESLNRHLIP